MRPLPPLAKEHFCRHKSQHGFCRGIVKRDSARSQASGCLWISGLERFLLMTVSIKISFRNGYRGYDPLRVFVPVVVRESVVIELADPEGGARPRPEDQPASPPGTPRRHGLRVH